MRRLVLALLPLASLAACVTILYACREPTQVTVRLTTDAPCGGDGFREAAVAVASDEALPDRLAEQVAWLDGPAGRAGRGC